MNLSKPVIDIIGYCAAAMTTTALIPQLARVVKTRSAGDISLGMSSIYTCGVLSWLTYGLLAHTMPVLIANCVSLVLASSIVGATSTLIDGETIAACLTLAARKTGV